ncbi:MAG: hypothetical protein ACK4KT_06125 [Thermaurantimonas sp.]
MKTLGIHCILIAVIIPVYSIGQDRIITRKNQRIESRILPVKDKEYVYFQILEDGELKYTLLPKNQIKRIDRNFYKNPIINTKINAPFTSHHSFMIAVRSGLGRRSYQVDPGLLPQLKDFQNRERFGWHNELEVSYLFSETFGIHVMYHRFSNNLERSYQFVNPGNPSEPFDATFKSNQMTSGVNVGLDYYTIFTEKANMSVGLSLGSTNFRYFTDLDAFASPTTFRGENLNLTFRLLGQYKLNDFLYFNGGISFFSSSLFMVRAESNGVTQELNLSNNPLSLSRMNFTVGIRYGFNL